MAVEQLAVRRADFLPEAWSILAGIEEALGGLSSPHVAAAEHLLLVLTHRMAGSAAMFGLEAASRVADAMESATQRLGDGADREASSVFLRESLVRLTGLLEDEPPPAADPITRELRELASREPEVLEYFLPEMREHLEGAEEALVRLAGTEPLASTEAAEAVAVVFRRIHTLKGAAFVVGCQPVGELAHGMEDVLVLARAQPSRFDAALAHAALAAVDLLHRMAEVLDGRPAPGEMVLLRDAVLARLAARGAVLTIDPPDAPAPLAPPAPPPPALQTPPARKAEGQGAPGLRLQLRAVDELVHLTGELLAVRNRLHGEIERLEVLREQRQASVERLRQTLRDFSSRHFDPLTPAAAVPGIRDSTGDTWAMTKESPASHFSELELDRYDDFNILARRLDEITADLAEEESQEAELSRQLAAGIDDLRRWVDDLHAGVGRLRLVPIGQIFGRCARQVRRAAAVAGKQVELEIVGERVEIDAAIAEQIWEPLLHLVQNAVDHSFEPVETRRALGKPAAGRLTLRASAEGRRVVVEVEDDGAGIDPGRVRTRARELGLRPAEELERLDERGALELIFLPGLSTLAVATASSGRGVGLDVVRTTLERLGGSAEVRPTAAGGTCFRLAFPLTLVVSEALLVRAGDEIVALPATAVERIVEASLVDGAPPLTPGGAPVPAIDLARVLGSAAGRSGERAPAAIVGSPGRWRALLVDEVLGSETAVLRPLGPFFARFDLFSGALLTRDGRLRLLLNTQAVIAASGGAARRLPSAATEPAPRVRPLRVLLADDSVSVRKVLGGILTRAGYDVVLAADGEEAVELLEAGPCDLLVTDLEMPRRNGYELVAWVRRRPATARMPVVVVTTRVGEKHLELARQVGATSCLSKPVGEDLLLRTVAGLVAHGERSDS